MSDQNQGGGDTPVNLFIGTCLLIAFGWLIWYFFSTEILSGVRWFRYAEMWLISLFVEESYAISFNGSLQYLRDWMYWLPKADPDGFTGSHLMVMSWLVVTPARLAITIILGLFALWSMLRGPGTHFHRVMSIDSLIKAQSKAFPTTAPFIHFDPNKLRQRVPGTPVPTKLPIFAEALAPEEWVAYKRIPIEEDGKPNKEALRQALIKQLGPRWQGPQKLPEHCKAFFAVCALKTVRKRKDADDLLNEIMGCWDPGKGLRLNSKIMNKVNKIIRDKNVGGKIAQESAQHAYRTTALMRALWMARREGGVLAPAQFIWMRAHHRALWYPLNNVGRRSFHAEALGAQAHYQAEKVAGKPIPAPKVDNAVDNIIQTLALNPDRKIPELDPDFDASKFGMITKGIARFLKPKKTGE